MCMHVARSIGGGRTFRSWGGGRGKVKLGGGGSLAIGRIRTGGGGGGGGGGRCMGSPLLDASSIYNGVSTRHSRLAAEAPPSRQQGGVGECCKSPDPQKLSHFTLQIRLKISRLPCEYMNTYPHRKKMARV